MSTDLTEEEMRRALFGSAASQPIASVMPTTPPVTSPGPVEAPFHQKVKAAGKSLSPRLRVTLRVTKVFEGEVEVFTYDANTLSSFDAEQQAKTAAKKLKYKYFDVVSVKPVSV
ncbi:hypothetical protein SAMN03159444_01950 [Pseudomonas sp. NFACC02]|uniref:hypothetical protein n=1 Tax=Pseudomonas sp. NFACC02 TaxID=1566250 RepID=UPI0008D6DF37|nr:hypothetical protein [Pseudomonas sp. NFACC02]SEQ56100.1 hypothetical protein SAMN03159444_01950 [Pseudomonas sp. NFACC02]